MSKIPAAKDKSHFAFVLLASLFFLWGFIASLNTILIPHLKGLFQMNYSRTMLIQVAFFGAFLTMAVPASIVIGKIGLKKGIVLGLIIVGLGCLLFLPAAYLISYTLFLSAIFIMSTGTVFLEVVGNPYISALGSPETASSRLNFVQGINSLGTILAPLMGAYLILGNFTTVSEKASSVQAPYTGLAIFAFFVAVIFLISKLPTVDLESKEKIAGNVFKFRQLRNGVIALTLYVGAEVTIGSFIVGFLGKQNIGGFSEDVAAKYISLYWGGLMVGRFAGAAILKKVSTHIVLAWSSSAAFLLVGITILSEGSLAMWAMLSVGLFNSIMWSNIFALSIHGLGKYTIKASGILVMAPVGGAIIPFIQGVFADMPSIGLQYSYSIPLISYIFIIFYALNGYKAK